MLGGSASGAARKSMTARSSSRVSPFGSGATAAEAVAVAAAGPGMGHESEDGAGVTLKGCAATSAPASPDQRGDPTLIGELAWPRRRQLACVCHSGTSANGVWSVASDAVPENGACASSQAMSRKTMKNRKTRKSPSCASSSWSETYVTYVAAPLSFSWTGPRPWTGPGCPAQ